MKFQHFFDLSKYNTFGIQAHANYYAAFHDLVELREALANLPQEPILILGGGSNILITQDIKGTVLHNQMKGMEVVSETEEHVYLKVGAGVVWHDLVDYTMFKNWGGLENLSLIPGSVGASPMQNIGAYGVEIKDVMHELEAYHLENNEVQKFSNTACGFGYRESVFKRKFKGEFVILNVTYRLSKQHQIKMDYGAIQDVLREKGISSPSIQDISAAVIQIRQSKLPDPKVIGNAGSFFKNPVVSKTIFERIVAEYPGAPSYRLNEMEFKVPAGWLIETAGWKGKDFGCYGVHDKQALVLVNRGGAKGSEIYDLSTKILEDIYSKFGVKLEREVNLVG